MDSHDQNVVLDKNETNSENISTACSCDGHHHHHQDNYQESYDDLHQHNIDFNNLYINRPNKFSIKANYQIDDSFELYGIKYVQYKDETQMPLIMDLITKDLSEPYSIYTYRYFIHNWPYLCFLVQFS